MAALDGVSGFSGKVYTPNNAEEYTKAELRRDIPKGNPNRSNLIKRGSGRQVKMLYLMEYSN